MEEKDTTASSAQDPQNEEVAQQEQATASVAGEVASEQPTQAVAPAGETGIAASESQPAQQPIQPTEPASTMQPTTAQPTGDPVMQQPPVAGQAPQGAPMQPPTAPAQQPSPTGALVCGILAIVFCWIPIVGIILGIVAIVLAGKYFKSGGTQGSGKAGRICGIIGIVLSAIMIVVNFITIFASLAALDSYSSSSSYNLTSSSATSAAYDENEEAIQEVVEARLNLIQEQDPAMLAQIQAVAEDSFTEAFALSSVDTTMQQCGIDPATFVSYMTDGFKYEPSYMLAEGAEEGDEGTAAFYLTARDITAILNDTDSDMDASSMAGMSLEERQTAFGGILMDNVMAAYPESDLYFSVDLTYTGGQWVIDEDSWNDEMEYFFGFL